MILVIKGIIFISMVVVVKLVFIYINENEDRKIEHMYLIIRFVEYLRVYSCDMQMSLGEIMSKYNFPNNNVKKICYKSYDLIKCNENKNNSSKKLNKIMEKTIFTPKEFNNYFSDIITFYGISEKNILEKKLLYIQNEMNNIAYNYKSNNVEKKNFYNRISIILGVLTAIIFI